MVLMSAFRWAKPILFFPYVSFDPTFNGSDISIYAPFYVRFNWELPFKKKKNLIESRNGRKQFLLSCRHPWAFSWIPENELKRNIFFAIIFFIKTSCNLFLSSNSMDPLTSKSEGFMLKISIYLQARFCFYAEWAVNCM